MDGKLLCKVIQRIKRVAGIEPLLILAVTALDLAVVPAQLPVPNPPRREQIPAMAAMTAAILSTTIRPVCRSCFCIALPSKTIIFLSC